MAGGRLRTPGAFTNTLEAPQGGKDSIGFSIRGNQVSSAVDNVLVAASFKGQIFGAESITVLGFQYLAEAGHLPRPSSTMTTGNFNVNPAVRRSASQVIAFDAGHPSASLSHDAAFYGGTSPVLVNLTNNRDPISRKFGPGDIEVTWGRIIKGVWSADLMKFSTDGSANPSPALEVAPVGQNGSNGPVKSNLRIVDGLTLGAGAKGTQYHYYLGHPTEKLVGGLTKNFARRVRIDTKDDITYNLNLTVISPTGTVAGANLTLPDLQRIVDEASRVWEQVGVRFTWSGTPTVLTPTVPTELDLPDDEPATIVNVTKRARANGIDLFIVNTLSIPGSFLSGRAAIEDEWGVGDRETGALIARRRGGTPTSPFEDISSLARTTAHEIGHLILNSSWHDESSAWELMRNGSTVGGEMNAHVPLSYRDDISILPGGSDGYNNDESW